MRSFLLLGALALAGSSVATTPEVDACGNPETVTVTSIASAVVASSTIQTSVSAIKTHVASSHYIVPSAKPTLKSVASSKTIIYSSAQSSVKSIPSAKTFAPSGSTKSTLATVASSKVVAPSSSAKTTLATVASSKAVASSHATSVAPSSAAGSASAIPVSSVAATTVAVPAAPASCTASEYAQITSVVAACKNIVLQDIAAPVSSMIDLTGLQAGSTVTFAGKTTFGTTPSESFNPIEISGTDITITGAAGAIIDGNGQNYWDGQGSNGGSKKPDHFIVLSKMVNSVVQNLHIQNWPTHCFDVTGCNGLTITGITLDNSAGDAPNSASGSLPAAHNSDGFDFGSSNNIILSNSVVKNQDDCVAVTSGTNVTVTGLTCSGGHGLSIGSVGGKSNNVVSDITFSDSTVTNSINGCRIKSNSGTTGSIKNITYRNIKLSGITGYGIDIQQDYLNGGPTGKPTSGVTISGVTLDTITGTTTSSATDYYVLCGTACSDISFTGVSISGGGHASSCNFPSTGCPA